MGGGGLLGENLTHNMAFLGKKLSLNMGAILGKN